MWLTFLMVAITPAVCEEVLFRGPILRGLARGFPPWLAIGISAALFSLFHLNPYRLVPTFALGVMLGWLALRTGSLLPGMIMHFLNNGIVILLSVLGAESALAEMSPSGHAGLLAGSMVVVGTGTWIIHRVERTGSSQM